MSTRICARHRIHLPAPIGQCHRFFTAAGEELWIDGWRPSYVHPTDGRTEAGMVFTTGEDEQFTIWTMVDFDTERHYSRFVRVTPALRTALVEIQCHAGAAGGTDVEVRYTLTALTPQGAASLADFEGPAFVAMIEGWARNIASNLPTLLAQPIR